MAAQFPVADDELEADNEVVVAVWSVLRFRRILAGLLIGCLTSLHIVALASSGPPSLQSMKVTQTVENGVEVVRGRSGDVRLESRRAGEKLTTTITVRDRVEVVKADQNSPFFTVTVNGKTTTYDRRNFLVKEERFPVPPAPVDGGRGALTEQDRISISGIWVDPEEEFGRPYSDRWIASQSVYSPAYVSAGLYESFYW